MRVLALDLSTHTGFAILEGEMGTKPKRLVSGTIDLDKPLFAFGSYPHNYRKAAAHMARQIYATAIIDDRAPPDAIVVEEINSGRSRYVQKMLENIHTAVLVHFDAVLPRTKIVYLNSDGADGWRTNIGLTMSKEQKKANAKLSKAKRAASDSGTRLDKKRLGIKGKVTKKHLAVIRANVDFGLGLKQKDNNEADALLLGLAFFNNATPCTGE